MASTHIRYWIRQNLWAIALGASISLMVGTIGCETGPADSLFDPDRDFRSDPVISTMNPPGQALAGIGTITIEGQNFSPVPEENLVFFDDVRATVLEASPTQLVVRSPNLPKQGISVKVTVVGAENVSNAGTYILEPAVVDFGAIKDFEEPFAIATDDDGNVYVSLFANAASVGIKKILPDGTRQDYVSTTFKWDALELASDGYLYGVRGVQAIFRFPPGGGERENWAILSDRSARLVALDFDEQGNAWVGGRGGNIYRITPDVNITSFPFEQDVRALKTFAGHLYVASVTGPNATIWRFPITDAGLGPQEPYFALTQETGAGVVPFSLAFSQSGELFVGTNAPDPLILVDQDGSWEFFYRGLLKPPAFSLAWGQGPNLFLSRTDTEGSPGRIVKINTQREGAR